MDNLPINHNTAVGVECGHGAVDGLRATGHGAGVADNRTHGGIPASVIGEWVVTELVVDGLKGVELPSQQVGTVVGV